MNDLTTMVGILGAGLIGIQTVVAFVRMSAMKTALKEAALLREAAEKHATSMERHAAALEHYNEQEFHATK